MVNILLEGQWSENYSTDLIYNLLLSFITLNVLLERQ